MAHGAAPPPPPRWYYRSWSVVFLLFFVLGPFGLPLLWRSRGFSRGMKIALTVTVMAYTALLVQTMLMAIRVAMEQMELARAPITVAILS
jgi:hypothetical protein